MEWGLMRGKSRPGEDTKYYDTLQVTLGNPVGTVRKTFAIRNRLDEI